MSGRSFSHHCSLGILCLQTAGRGRQGSLAPGNGRHGVGAGGLPKWHEPVL